jgi:raffinose/stachyose/melibiose transport system permease protein
MSSSLAEFPPLIRKESIWRRIVRRRECYLLLVPTFALLVIFNYFPAGSAIYHSFFNWNGANVEVFNGFENFTNLFTNPDFLTSIFNVVKITVISILISISFPLLTALLIYRMRVDNAAYFYKVLYVIPMVVPSVVIFLIWKFIYSPTDGILNSLLTTAGLTGLTRTWLGDYNTALYAILFVNFPWVSGFQTLIFLAGLQNISVSVTEAAILDGTGPVQRFFSIELPLIASQIKLIVILAIINSVQGFVNILIMTNGGPGKSTMVPGLYLYRNAMQYGKMGYACSIGTFLFIVILTLTYLNLKYMKSNNDAMGA